jgi:hypothetical protein
LALTVLRANQAEGSTRDEIKRAPCDEAFILQLRTAAQCNYTKHTTRWFFNRSDILATAMVFDLVPAG